MNLNKQELEFIIQCIDRTVTNTIDTVVMKGSLLIKFATDLNTHLQPPKKAAPLKEVKK